MPKWAWPPDIALIVAVALGGGVLTLYALTLRGALKRCSASNRFMSPNLVWLLLIPFFDVVWHFVVVLKIAKSLRAEYASRAIPAPEPEPGKRLGLALCIVGVVALFPFWHVDEVAQLMWLVLWIVYWARMSGYSRQLAEPRLAPV